MPAFDEEAGVFVSDFLGGEDPGHAYSSIGKRTSIA
jgi:hypothetical protein